MSKGDETKALRAEIESLNGRLAISKHISDRYRDLIAAHVASGETLIGRVAAQRLAITDMNLMESAILGPVVRFSFPAVTFVLPVEPGSEG